MHETSDPDYAQRLVDTQGVWWKKALHVQAPYQANLRRSGLGRASTSGAASAGTWRPSPRAPSASTTTRRRRGRAAPVSPPHGRRVGAERAAPPESFDGMLVAHVAEHLTPQDARTILGMYVPLRPGGGSPSSPRRSAGTRATTPTYVTSGSTSSSSWPATSGSTIRTGSFPFPAGRARRSSTTSSSCWPASQRARWSRAPAAASVVPGRGRTDAAPHDRNLAIAFPIGDVTPAEKTRSHLAELPVHLRGRAGLLREPARRSTVLHSRERWPAARGRAARSPRNSTRQ